MDNLIIAVCILGIVVVASFWVLAKWDHPGKESIAEKKSHRRLLEEVRRHSEKQERG